MATATATVLGSTTLTGSTPNPASAPTTYTLTTPVSSYTLTTLNITNTLAIDDTRTKLTFASGDTLIIPNTQLSSFINGLAGAKVEVDAKIKSEVVVAAPAPAPAPAPTTYKAPPPIDSELAGSPEFQAQAVGNPPVPAAIAAATEQVEGAPLTGPQVITGVDGVEPPPPLAISTIGDAPLVNTDQINADIANIQFQEPDFPDYAEIYSAESQATEQDQANFAAKADWRVRLSLAPDSQYLYNDPEYAGILKPLKETDGVIFPYTPSITVNYAANYEATNIVHSNYKIYQYSGSAVEQVTIACDFTCQDTHEANYLLSVIHFFRSMTKMFYGQDTLPKNGTPPPLCYMFGMGGYQFAAHPLAISGFSYNLPADVDYIKTTSASPAGAPVPNTADVSATRLAGTNVGKGGTGPGPKFNTGIGNETVTWVPTKIQLSITCLPIMSRNAISNQFSLRRYGSGDLVLGTRKLGGGMW